MMSLPDLENIGLSFEKETFFFFLVSNFLFRVNGGCLSTIGFEYHTEIVL